MTEKRFEIKNNMGLDSKYVETYELSCIVDNSNKTFYFVVDSIANVESFVERLNELYEENEHYKSIFFELVETALTDKNCRELYCKGILDIFDKANSLNQARDMIKEFLE